MVANRSIEEGEEVFNTYDSRGISNVDLLCRYGFLIEGNARDVITFEEDEVLAILEEFFGLWDEFDPGPSEMKAPFGWQSTLERTTASPAIDNDARDPFQVNNLPLPSGTANEMTRPTPTLNETPLSVHNSTTMMGKGSSTAPVKPYEYRIHDVKSKEANSTFPGGGVGGASAGVGAGNAWSTAGWKTRLSSRIHVLSDAMKRRLESSELLQEEDASDYRDGITSKSAGSYEDHGGLERPQRGDEADLERPLELSIDADGLVSLGLWNRLVQASFDSFLTTRGFGLGRDLGPSSFIGEEDEVVARLRDKLGWLWEEIDNSTKRRRTGFGNVYTANTAVEDNSMTNLLPTNPWVQSTASPLQRGPSSRPTLDQPSSQQFSRPPRRRRILDSSQTITTDVKRETASDGDQDATLTPFHQVSEPLSLTARLTHEPSARGVGGGPGSDRKTDKVLANRSGWGTLRDGPPAVHDSNRATVEYKGAYGDRGYGEHLEEDESEPELSGEEEAREEGMTREETRSFFRHGKVAYSAQGRVEGQQGEETDRDRTPLDYEKRTQTQPVPLSFSTSSRTFSTPEGRDATDLHQPHRWCERDKEEEVISRTKFGGEDEGFIHSRENDTRSEKGYLNVYLDHEGESGSQGRPVKEEPEVTPTGATRRVPTLPSSLSSMLGKEGRVRDDESDTIKRRVEVVAGSEEGGRSRKRRKVAEERPVDGERQERGREQHDHEDRVATVIDHVGDVVAEIGMTGLVVWLMVRLCQSRLDTMWHGECVEEDEEEEESEEVILAKRYVFGEKAILKSCLESWRAVAGYFFAER
ncbi:hypothetical protein CPB86DRAFT_39032 [Serendipita vermifera]|nr:hypothetical protein CPB86DRAFT_39032 [Serendipita vermifera]